MTDDNGAAVRFINDPLDERYIEPPEDWTPEGMLPPQDFEVRKALVEMKLFTERFAEMGLWQRLMNKSAYEHARQLAIEKQRALQELVDSSAEHKAAIRRIVNAMPPGNGGREALASYIV